MVAAWMRTLRPPGVTSAWVTARSSVNEYDSFDAWLSDALRGAGVKIPTSGGASRGGLAELEVLLDSARPRPERFVLMVDGFDEVQDPRVLEQLVSLLRTHPDFHLIVCCEGPHVIESLGAGLSLVVVEPADDPSAAEIAGAVAELLDHPWSERLGDDLAAWVTALQTADDAPALAGAGPGPSGDGPPVLGDTKDDAVLGHLMRMSLAGPMNWAAFRDACDDPDPRQFLEALQATGLVERVDAGDETLFTVSTAVRQLFRERLDAEEVTLPGDLHRRLFEVASARRQTAPSALEFHDTVAEGDWDRVAHLWFGSVAAMLGESPELVHEALEELPAEVLRANPSMLALRDTLRMASLDTDDDGRRATMRVFADTCARLVQRGWGTMPLNELVVVGTGAIIQLRMVGRFQDSEALGDRISARIGAQASVERIARGRLAWFHLHRGITFSLLADDPSALRSYHRAWEHATGADVDFVRSHAAANAALTYAVRGATLQARRWLRRHQSLDITAWPGHHILGVGGHVAAGLLALDRLDTAEVERELAHVGDGMAPTELWPFVAFLAAEFALYSGEPREGLSRLEQALTGWDHDLATRGVASALLTRAQADLLIACRHGERARRLVERAASGKALLSLPAGRLRVLGGLAEAGRYVDRLTWDPATSQRDRLEMLLLGAVAALRRTDTRSATRLVNQALELYGETGILRSFAAVPRSDLPSLLALADQRLSESDEARLAEQPEVYPERLVLIELSEREHAVLRALATTSSRQHIADSMFVSLNTIKTQLASIYQKVGASTRDEALRKARDHGLLSEGLAD